MKNRTALIQGAKCELSRREFWQYCRTKAPDFYKKDRCFLHEFCDDLQSFIEPTDVIYTKDGMEITEPAVAKMLYEDKVNIADIESNNGGRGFARNVESILRSKFSSNQTVIHPFFQSKNKISRILSNSTWVMNHIYFPVNWQDRFPDYYLAMVRYQKEGKNAHDDAPDATTGIAENIGGGSAFSFD